MRRTSVLMTYQSGVWSSWQSLGGSAASSPDITSWEPNRRDVVYRDAAGYIQHKYWNGSTWSGWAAIPNKTFASAPSITSTGFGRLDLVARDSAGTVWHTFTDGVTPFGTWDAISIFMIGAPVIVSEWSQSFTVFATSSDNKVWEISWLSTAYTDWAQVTNPIGVAPNLPGCGVGSAAVGKVVLVCSNPASGVSVRLFRRGY